MQKLGRQYVGRFSARRRRTGTLWEGRYKSCLFNSRNYLLRCYRHIELEFAVVQLMLPSFPVPSGFRFFEMRKSRWMSRPLYQACSPWAAAAARAANGACVPDRDDGIHSRPPDLQEATAVSLL